MRYYAIQTWVGSHENQPEYNGQQAGARNAPSVEVPTFDRNGKPNFKGFSDEAIQARKPKKKSALTIQQKILPQQSRVERLTDQMTELVKEYKAGNIDIDEYSMLLSVISSKRSRAEELLIKAKSVRAPFEIEEEEAISLGKTHVKSEKSFKTSKRTTTEGSRFKDTKKPTISDNRSKLSKVADWINNHQFTYFVVCSTIALTAAKLVF
jgi:hypothetical protein